MKIVETRKLTKMYGKARGIVDLDMTVEEGEIFGFIGPNGAGKSTTIRTLLSLIRKTSGEARIFGMDCEKDRVKILEQVGYLPSEIFYYDHMKAKELLEYSASFYPVDSKNKIKKLSERLDLDLNKKIEDMSLGNKKKVGIIQGLLHSPKLIILDEPTSGLDPLIQKEFFEIIKEENSNGATVLFSSHILSEVQKISDRVGIIKEGNMIQVQKMSDLIANNYKKIVFTLGEEQKPIDFSIGGISDLKKEKNAGSFIYKGDCNDLLKEIIKYQYSNIEITEPSLEEIFIHYYSNSKDLVEDKQ